MANPSELSMSMSSCRTVSSEEEVTLDDSDKAGVAVGPIPLTLCVSGFERAEK